MRHGFLVVFSDVDRTDETDYLHWLTREHVQERLSIPGFLAARIFRAEIHSGGRYFIFYRLLGAGVVGSDGYLARLNAPTPWSQKIMPKLKNFMRGGGSILQESGEGEGGLVAPVLLDRDSLPQYREAAVEIAKADRIAATRIFEVDPAASGIGTNEKAMRSGDASFDALLLLEALDERELSLGLAVMEVPERLVYRQIFALSGSGVSA